MIVRPNPGPNFSAANYTQGDRWKNLWPELTSYLPTPLAKRGRQILSHCNDASTNAASTRLTVT